MVSAKFFAALVAVAALFAGEGDVLKYDDGQPDGKKSLGSSGEIIAFALPDAETKIGGVRIHGSRYGVPKAPDESFLIYFLTDDMSDVVAVRMAPYSLFDRGEEKWVDVKFEKPVEVPRTFHVAVDFRAHQTKGVYVSFDTSTKGEHSFVGLPGVKAKPVDFDGDWMIEAIPAK
jgi:RNA polymerase sigma-70 factor (ECF subfamily)